MFVLQAGLLLHNQFVPTTHKIVKKSVFKWYIFLTELRNVPHHAAESMISRDTYTDSPTNDALWLAL